MADAVWPNRSAAGGGGFRARRFTSICEITETIGARMDSEAPRLRLGNEDLQSVRTDAKVRRAENHVKLTRSRLEAFVKFRDSAVKVQRCPKNGLSP